MLSMDLEDTVVKDENELQSLSDDSDDDNV